MTVVDTNSIIVWAVWLGLFLIFELAALTKHVPWVTLSELAWKFEDWRPGLRWVFLIGLAVLLVHIVSRWP